MWLPCWRTQGAAQWGVFDAQRSGLGCWGLMVIGSSGPALKADEVDWLGSLPRPCGVFGVEDTNRRHRHRQPAAQRVHVIQYIYIYYTIMSLLSDNVFCNSPHDYRFCCHRNGIDLHGQTQTQKDLIRLFPQCACCMCKEQRTALTKQILIQIQFFLPDLVLGLIQTCVEQDLPTRIL